MNIEGFIYSGRGRRPGTKWNTRDVWDGGDGGDVGHGCCPTAGWGVGGYGVQPPSTTSCVQNPPVPPRPYNTAPKRKPQRRKCTKRGKNKGERPHQTPPPPKKVWVWDALWGLTPPGVGLGADQPQRVDLGADPPPKMWVWGQTPTPGVGMG